jgi:hypothetical protein
MTLVIGFDLPNAGQSLDGGSAPLLDHRNRACWSKGW